MNDAMTTQAPSVWYRLHYFPVSVFGSVMGLTGLSASWHLASELFGVSSLIGVTIGWISVLDFILVSLAYLLKLITSMDAVKAEFKHPIASNLFGTAPSSMLLVPIVLAPIDLRVAQWLWAIGVIAMSGLAWTIVNRWMSDRQQTPHAIPAWIVPVVGLLDIPLAVPYLGLPPTMHGVMMFGFAVGICFAGPLFTIIFSRLLFEPPLPDALLPTLMILVAPFAVGFSSYVVISGQVDLFAQVLYMMTLFMLTVLIGRLRYLPICCPFKISWWSVSFPLAACALAALKYAIARPDWMTEGFACVILIGVTLVIAGLLIRSIAGVLRGELRALSS
jgi:tellurite resistance protein